MIREVATKKGSTGARGFLLVLGICMAVVLLSTLVGYLQNTLGVNHLEYVIYALLFVLGFVLIKVYVTQYRYSLINDELIIEKLMGKRVASVVALRIWEIECFVSCREIDKAMLQECNAQKHCVDKKNTWAVVYHRDEKRQAILFNPSSELIESLSRALAHRNRSKTTQPDS